MSKQKSITEQIEELQASNKKLTDYEKLFDKACLLNFGCSSKNIQKIILNNEEPCSNFETTVRTFFGLQTSADIGAFISIICTAKIRNFFEQQKEKLASENQGQKAGCQKTTGFLKGQRPFAFEQAKSRENAARVGIKNHRPAGDIFVPEGVQLTLVGDDRTQ